MSEVTPVTPEQVASRGRCRTAAMVLDLIEEVNQRLMDAGPGWEVFIDVTGKRDDVIAEVRRAFEEAGWDTSWSKNRMIVGPRGMGR